MTGEQNSHRDPKYDPNRLVRKDLAKSLTGMRIGERISQFAEVVTGRARIRPRAPVSTADLLQTN